MAYLVLARKARPQTFDEVVGQSSIVKTLQNSIVRQRIAHAILFSGVRGVGKTTLARIMAKAINCLADRSQRPCCQCAACLELQSGASLDLYEIDGASNRGIQEIRELKEKIRFLPSSVKYKIFIIDEVHMLTTEAFNALLKTLEEPPEHVYFMFATTEIHKIPITILSRCQQYELKRLSADQLYNHFQKLSETEGFSIDPGGLSLIVREAGGSVRDGLSLLDQMFSFGDTTISLADVVEVLGLVNRDILIQIARGLLDADKQTVFLRLNEVFSFGVDLKRFMQDLMAIFRSLLLLQIKGCENLVDLPAEDLQQLAEISSSYSGESLHLKLVLLLELSEKLKNSTQPHLTLETSLLKIIETGNIVPVAQLLSHFDKLTADLPLPDTRPPQDVHQSPPQNVKKKIDPPAVAQEITATASQPPSLPPASESEAKVKESIEKTADKVAGEQPAHTPQATVQNDTEVAGSARVFELHPHERNIRSNWPQFIEYVKDRKEWMAQDLLRADSIKNDITGELQLHYNDPVNCALLRERENLRLLTEFAIDFFQQVLKIRFVIPKIDDSLDENGNESPQKKRQQLATDPLTVMAAEVFNGQIGDIRIGPRSR